MVDREALHFFMPYRVHVIGASHREPTLSSTSNAIYIPPTSVALRFPEMQMQETVFCCMCNVQFTARIYTRPIVLVATVSYVISLSIAF